MDLLLIPTSLPVVPVVQAGCTVPTPVPCSFQLRHVNADRAAHSYLDEGRPDGATFVGAKLPFGELPCEFNFLPKVRTKLKFESQYLS